MASKEEIEAAIELNDLPMFWEGRAKALRLLNAQQQTDVVTAETIIVYERCAEELRASITAAEAARKLALLAVRLFQKRAWLPDRARPVFAPAMMIDGRCCGRKSIEYKRSPDHFFFCPKCDREYWPNGEQRQNWAFRLTLEGNFMLYRPISIDEERALIAKELGDAE